MNAMGESRMVKGMERMDEQGRRSIYTRKGEAQAERARDWGDAKRNRSSTLLRPPSSQPRGERTSIERTA